MLLLLMLGCTPAVLTNGWFSVHGQANPERSEGAMVLPTGLWSVEDLGDGTWSVHAFDTNNSEVWGSVATANDEGVLAIEIEQASPCPENSERAYHEIRIEPVDPENFEGIWDLWQQEHACDAYTCTCTGPDVVRTWALDLTGEWYKLLE